MTRTKSIHDEQILEIIGQLLRRDGVAAFTFEKISREVGLSQATLVQRFGSKSNLLLTLTELNAKKTVEIFRQVTQQINDPLEALLEGLRIFVAGAEDMKDMALNLSFLQFAIQDSKTRKTLAEGTRNLENELANLLEKALYTGHLKPNTDIAALARLVFAAYSGTSMVWAMLGDVNLQQELERNLNMVIGPYLAR